MKSDSVNFFLVDFDTMEPNWAALSCDEGENWDTLKWPFEQKSIQQTKKSRNCFLPDMHFEVVRRLERFLTKCTWMRKCVHV